MKFDEKEANDRLETITEMCYREMQRDMLVSTQEAMANILAVAVGGEIMERQIPVMDNPHIVISCDASIKENPGGPSALGTVIDVPDREPLQLSRRSKATTCNQAEYEAVYFGLTSLFGMLNNPRYEVEVRSDSRLVVNQLNGDMKCRDENLQKKRDVILEYIKGLPVQVKFVWRPRNSTPELKTANYLAQDELGVPRH